VTGPAPSRVRVEAPARLHLGFIDLEGSGGRVFGSVGVALERPRYVVEARTGGEDAGGEDAADIRRVRHALEGRIAVPAAVALRVHARIPRHQGLGSGTQRDLALGTALCRMAGETVGARAVARLVGRGRRSGVGVATFDRGGLVVDAGARRDEGRGLGTPAGPEPEPPPVVFQGTVPRDWRFVVAMPRGGEGLHGAREEQAFRDLAPMSEASVGRISRLLLMAVMPGVLTDDLEAFGAAITEIQRLVGEYFSRVQGGAYATECGRAIADLARAHGAAGVGQSSWGPAVFALVRGEEHARVLAGRIEAWAGSGEVSVFHTAADAVGAVVETVP
jgi:beta-RFAP synthase